MAKSKKYDYQVVENNASWSVQITRRVTSKKTVVTKKQDEFASEAQAREWGEKMIAEFASKLSSSNQRQGKQRKAHEEERRLRSSRRADKTLNAKEAKLEAAQNIATVTDAEENLVSGFDPDADQ